KGQIDGVQHQFDGHQYHDQVAPDENADDSDGENDRAEDEIIVKRHHLKHAPSSPAPPHQQSPPATGLKQFQRVEQIRQTGFSPELRDCRTTQSTSPGYPQAHNGKIRAPNTPPAVLITPLPSPTRRHLAAPMCSDSET